MRYVVISCCCRLPIFSALLGSSAGVVDSDGGISITSLHYLPDQTCIEFTNKAIVIMHGYIERMLI